MRRSLGVLSLGGSYPIGKVAGGRHSATLELERIADVTHWVAGAECRRSTNPSSLVPKAFSGFRSASFSKISRCVFIG